MILTNFNTYIKFYVYKNQFCLRPLRKYLHPMSFNSFEDTNGLNWLQNLFPSHLEPHIIKYFKNFFKCTDTEISYKLH